MSKDLYDIVGDKIIEFCEKTYYADIVISFEQSYDGKEWTKEVEFATFYNGTNLCYESDWNEGQTHLRNLRIWHLEDSEPVVRCKDCKFWKHQGWKSGWCEQFNGAVTFDEGYCYRAQRSDEVEHDRKG